MVKNESAQVEETLQPNDNQTLCAFSFAHTHTVTHYILTELQNVHFGPFIFSHTQSERHIKNPHQNMGYFVCPIRMAQT